MANQGSLNERRRKPRCFTHPASCSLPQGFKVSAPRFPTPQRSWHESQILWCKYLDWKRSVSFFPSPMRWYTSTPMAGAAAPGTPTRDRCSLLFGQLHVSARPPDETLPSTAHSNWPLFHCLGPHNSVLFLKTSWWHCAASVSLLISKKKKPWAINSCFLSGNSSKSPLLFSCHWQRLTGSALLGYKGSEDASRELVLTTVPWTTSPWGPL